MCVRSSEGTPKLWSEMLIRRDDSLWLGKQTLTIVAFSVDAATVKLLHVQHIACFLRCQNVDQCKAGYWNKDSNFVVNLGENLKKKTLVINMLKEEMNLLAANNIFCQVETEL